MRTIIHGFLLVLVLVVTVPAKDEDKRFPKDRAIQHILRDMAKGNGISESEAKEAATEVCVRLWGSDELLKVRECKLDETGKKWVVLLYSDNGLDGWGCTVWIDKTGHLEKTEYMPGE